MKQIAGIVIDVNRGDEHCR